MKVSGWCFRHYHWCRNPLYLTGWQMLRSSFSIVSTFAGDPLPSRRQITSPNSSSTLLNLSHPSSEMPLSLASANASSFASVFSSSKSSPKSHQCCRMLKKSVCNRSRFYFIYCLSQSKADPFVFPVSSFSALNPWWTK